MCGGCYRQWLSTDEGKKHRYDKDSRRKMRPKNMKAFIEYANKFGYVETGRKYGINRGTVRKWIKLRGNDGIL